MHAAPAEAVKGYRRPHRDAIVHRCGELCIVSPHVAELLARQNVTIERLPCCRCREDRPVAEFTFRDGSAL